MPTSCGALVARVGGLAIVALLALAGLPAIPDAGAAARDAPARGTIERHEIAAPALHDPRRSVRVYLPPSYATDTLRRYPVVFLLHGWPGGDGNWPGSGHAGDTLDTLIARDRIPEIIAVMPDGKGVGFLGRSMYLNTFDGTSRMEDFIARDLVAWVDSTFRTRPEPGMRAIVGLSDGGSAAVNLAFKHPDVFGACGSHSGEFRLKGGMGESKILGPEPGASRLLAENSPLDYVERISPRLRGTTIYLDSGIGDRREIEQGRELHRVLDTLGIPNTWNEYPGGHTWGYWRSHLPESLRAVTARMW